MFSLRLCLITVSIRAANKMSQVHNAGRADENESAPVKLLPRLSPRAHLRCVDEQINRVGFDWGGLY